MNKGITLGNPFHSYKDYMSLPFHIPGRPKSTEPVKLVSIASSLRHPAVIRSGVTTTEAGDWALLVVVKRGTPVPIKEIEHQYPDFPIIYQEDSGRIPIARPAYPALGE